MSRTFVLKVEGVTPDVNAQMIKDAIENALEKVKGSRIIKFTMDKDLHRTLTNINITQLTEQ